MYVHSFYTFTDKDEDSEEDSEVSVTPEGSSEEEDNSLPTKSIKNKRESMKQQSAMLAERKGKPLTQIRVNIHQTTASYLQLALKWTDVSGGFAV